MNARPNSHPREESAAPENAARSGAHDNGEPFTVAVVDDNRLVVEALERWFSQSARVRWAGSAGDAAGAVRLAARAAPHVLLLDVDMPGCDTFALLRRLAAEHPAVKVVMFSGHVRGEDIERALSEGAWGYIVKDEPGDTIIALLADAAAGQCVLSPMARAAWTAGR